MNTAGNYDLKRILAVLLTLVMLLTMLPQSAFAETQSYTGEQGNNPWITLKDSSSVLVSDIETDTDIEEYYHNTIKTELDSEADIRFVFTPTGQSTNGPAESDVIANTMPHIKIYRAIDALTGENPVAAYDGGTGALQLEQFKLGTASTSEYATIQLLIKAGTLQQNTEYALVFEKDLGVKKSDTTIGRDIVFYFKTKAPVSGLVLDKTTISTTIGQSETISAQFDQTSVDSSQVQWSSSNEDIAAVENGNVKAISEGTAVITAAYQGQEAQCTVKVGTIAYGMQGIGGNQFAMLKPDNITVLSENDERYLNRVNTSFHEGEDIEFYVTMSAGMQNFNEAAFISGNMNYIKVYDAYGGNILAQSSPEEGQAELQYGGFEATEGILLKLSAGALPKGTYYLVVGKQLAGNNPDKVLGKDIVFQFRITDPNESVDPEGVSLDWEELTLTKGTELKLKADVIPEDTTDKTVVWSSSDDTVVSVDDNGTIEALAAGNAEITVTTKNGQFSATCSITVEESSISIDRQSLELSLNEEQTLRAYKGGERIIPQWESSSPDVISVDENGRVKALATGHAVITASMGGQRALCIINATSSGTYGWQGVGGNTMILKSPDNIYVKEITEDCYYNGINTLIDGCQDIVFGFSMSAGMNNFNRDGIFTTYNMPRIKIYDSYPDGNILAQYNNTDGQAKLDMLEYDGSGVIYVTIPAETLKDGDYYLVFDKALCGNNLNKIIGKDVVFKFTVQWSVENLTVNLPEEGSSLEAAVNNRLSGDQTLEDIKKLHVVTDEGYALTDEDFSFIKEKLGQNLEELDLENASLDENRLGVSALEGCTSLEKLTLPPDLGTVCANALYGCSGLKTIKLTGSIPPTVEAASALEGSGITKVIVPSQYESVYNSASPWNQYTVFVEVESITLSEDSLEVEEGKSKSLAAEIFPENASDKTVEWISSDENIAVVDDTGNVIGVKSGDVTIKARTTDGGYEASCKVKVIPPLPIITLNMSKASIYTTGDDSTVQLKASVTGTYVYTDEDVEWESNDESVAIVDENGLVTGVAEGSAIILAWVGTQCKYCIVNVTEHTLSLNTTETGLLTTGTGNTDTLKATLDGTAVSGTAVTWSSSNAAVATVTRTGIITGKTAGTAVITASAKGKTATCKVTVSTLSKPTAKAASAAYNQVKVTWTGVSGASGYIVSRCTSSGTVTKSWTMSSTARSLTNTSLTSGTTYYYKVCAYKTINGVRRDGSYSTIVSAKPVPAAPTASAARYSYNGIKVTWSGVSGASGYQIYRSTSKTGTYKLVKTAASTARSYVNTGLTTGTTYYYKVRAYRTVNGSKVYGTFSAIKSAKPTLSTPGTPTVSKYSTGYVKVKWKGISGESGYQVYRSTSKTGTYTKVKSVTMTSSSYPYANIKTTKGKTYYYKVRAYKKVGSKYVYSSFSAVKSYKLK